MPKIGVRKYYADLVVCSVIPLDIPAFARLFIVIDEPYAVFVFKFQFMGISKI